MREPVKDEPFNYLTFILTSIYLFVFAVLGSACVAHWAHLHHFG